MLHEHLLRLIYAVSAAASVGLLALGLSCGGKEKESSSTPPAPPVQASQAPPPQTGGSPEEEDGAAKAFAHLIEQGWSERAARAVTQLNERFLRLAWEEEQAEWEKVVALWNRLAENVAAQQGLESLPELASLLAGSLEDSGDGPELILKSIPQVTEDKHIVLSLYCVYAEPAAAVRLAKALLEDGDLIVRLWRRGYLEVASPGFWLSLQNGRVDKLYRRWVRKVLDDALRDGDEALENALVVLDIHAPTIKKMLEKEHDFGGPFSEEYWPRFSRKLQEIRSIGDAEERDLLWNFWVIDHRVWQYYHRFAHRGNYIFDVFDRYGPVAIDLALAKEYEDRVVCDKVFRSLEHADALMINALANDELRGQPLFIELLKRDLGPSHLATAISRLGHNNAEAPRLLRYWHSLSDTALKEELGPTPEGVKTWVPGYGIFYLLKKVGQGRELESADWIWPGLDVAMLAPALKVPLAPLRQGIARQLGKTGIKGGAKLAAQAGARELAPLVLRQRSSQWRRARASGVASLFQADVTAICKLSFGLLKEMGLGRKTFRALTGAEARVFIRSDGRVILHLGDLLSEGSTLGKLLLETGMNAGIDITMQAHSVQEGVKQAIKVIEESPEVAAERLLAWRQHLSLWWTAVHSGALDKALNSGDSADRSNQ